MECARRIVVAGAEREDLVACGGITRRLCAKTEVRDFCGKNSLRPHRANARKLEGTILEAICAVVICLAC